MSFYNQFTPYKFANYGQVRLPEIAISSEEKAQLGLPANASNFEFLKALTRKGFKEKNFAKEKYKSYGERIKYELDIFEELGFTDYILLIWRIINKARELGVFIDFGRGSAPASQVFYCLGVTGVDAIDKQLIFERFVSKTRSCKTIIDGNLYLKGDLVADVDLNLGDGREQIVEWLKQIYPGRISNILNLSTFTDKILIKDVYKCYEEVPEDEARRVANMIEVHFGIVEDISKVYEDNKEFKTWADNHKDVFNISKALHGLIRQESCHASGYLVSFNELNDSIPLELSKEGELISGFDMREVCNFVIKVDLLSLTTNRIIKNVIDQTGVDISKINLDNDPFIYDKFQNGLLLRYGLYQISADCGYQVLSKIKAKNIFELSDAGAIARPGALAYLDQYVSGDAKSPHQIFDKIIKRTRNLFLYQEQLMQASVAIGFTLDDAEQIRKIVGKKLTDKVKVWKDKIYAKVKENNYPESIADMIWKILNDSAKYSFNLAHSLSTSYLSALTVYLKYKFPLEFYCACLNSADDFADPLAEISLVANELKTMGIPLLLPNIFNTNNGFYIEKNAIRFGIKSIRGISEKTLEKLQIFNKNNSTKFELFESFELAKIPQNVKNALILSGCIPSFGIGRNKLVLESECYNLLTDREKTLVHQYGMQYNFDLLNLVKDLNEKLLDEKMKPCIKDSRFDTIKRDFQPYKDKFDLNSKNEELCQYILENEYLGFSYSYTLKDIYSKWCDGLINLLEIKSVERNDRVRFAAQVVEIEKKKSRKDKTPYLRVTFKDEFSSVIGLIYGQDLLESIRSINGAELEEGQIVIINGSKSEDIIFCREVTIQENFTTIKKVKNEDKSQES